MFLDKKKYPSFIDLQGRINHIVILNLKDNTKIASYENIIKRLLLAKDTPWPDTFTIKIFENEFGLFNYEYLAVTVEGLVKNSKDFRELCVDKHPHLLI